MAPTFKSARCTRVLMAGVDLSVILNDSERGGTVDTAETTAYAQADFTCTTDKTYIVGHRDASLSFSGMADGSTDWVDEILDNAVGIYSTVEQRITWGPGGSSIGSRAYLTRGHLTEFTVTAPSADVVAVSASVQANESRGGVWLISPAAATTSTGAKAGVMDRTFWTSTSAAPTGSTGGAVIHFHYLSSSTRSTGTVVKAQHSSDNAAFADLATFTISSTIPGASRSTVAGSVKEWVRGLVSAKTSTFDPRIALAIARNPELSTSKANP